MADSYYEDMANDDIDDNKNILTKTDLRCSKSKTKNTPNNNSASNNTRTQTTKNSAPTNTNGNKNVQNKNEANKQNDPPKSTPDKTDNFLYLIKKGNPDKILGYKIELLDEKLTEMEKEFYLCPACGELIRDAHFTLKDTFCKSCVTDTIQYENTKIKEKIKKLVCICPLHKDKNCDWRGTIGEVEEHITKNCDHVIIICSHGCPALPIGPRKELNNHMDNMCPKRKIKCEHCVVVCVAEEYKDHLEECLRRPYECKLKCGLNIPREEMTTHVNDICDNTHVPCPYKELGCKAEMLRKQLRDHIYAEYLYHISITLNTVRDLNARINTLENKK